jgi:hypothetical protein
MEMNEIETMITAQINTNMCLIDGLRVAERYDTPIPDKNPKEVDRRNAIRDVCLNCTKEKCTGAEACYLREKRRRKND